MKKYAIAAIIWFCFLCSKVCSTSEAIPYILYMDSERTDLYEVKEEVLITYENLMRGVSDESDMMMLVHNLEEFEFDDTMKAQFRNHELEIVVGDGEGAFISGELERDLLCVPEVKPKSWLLEMMR